MADRGRQGLDQRDRARDRLHLARRARVEQQRDLRVARERAARPDKCASITASTMGTECGGKAIATSRSSSVIVVICGPAMPPAKSSRVQARSPRLSA